MDEEALKILKEAGIRQEDLVDFTIFNSEHDENIITLSEKKVESLINELIAKDDKVVDDFINNNDYLGYEENLKYGQFINKTDKRPTYKVETKVHQPRKVERKIWEIPPSHLSENRKNLREYKEKSHVGHDKEWSEALAKRMQEEAENGIPKLQQIFEKAFSDMKYDAHEIIDEIINITDENPDGYSIQMFQENAQSWADIGEAIKHREDLKRELKQLRHELKHVKELLQMKIEYERLWAPRISKKKGVMMLKDADDKVPLNDAMKFADAMLGDDWDNLRGAPIVDMEAERRRIMELKEEEALQKQAQLNKSKIGMPRRHGRLALQSSHQEEPAEEETVSVISIPEMQLEVDDMEKREAALVQELSTQTKVVKKLIDVHPRKEIICYEGKPYHKVIEREWAISTQVPLPNIDPSTVPPVKLVFKDADTYPEAPPAIPEGSTDTQNATEIENVDVEQSA